MSANSLFYTSWKNAISPSGFDIYAKSLEISDKDAARIVRLTRYVPKSDLPSEPSFAQIRERFPKKYTFFPLESGKFCVACSTYTGKDCYDKFGNYFTHALVLDSLQSLRPADFIGSDAFKYSLSDSEKQELYPKEPEKIDERDIARPLSDAELVRFLDTERLHILKKLATALLGSAQKRVGIIINDNETNLKYWLSAIYCVLPKSIANSVSFSTYGGDRSFFVVSGVENDPFMDSIDIQSYTFDMASGAADIRISPTPYIEQACALFVKDPFSAQRFTARMEELSELCDVCDIATAYHLWCIENNKFDVFKSSSELLFALEKYYKTIPEMAQRITKNVVFALSFSLSFPKNKELNKLLAFLFANAEPGDQNELLLTFIDQNLENCDNSQPALVYEAVRNSCICPWGEALSLLFEPTMLEHINAHGNRCAHYLICAIMVDSYFSAEEKKQKYVVDYLSRSCADYVINGDIPMAALILRCASRKASGIDNLVNARICQHDMAGLSSDPHRTFEYIEITDTWGDCFWTLLINCAKTSPESIETLIPAYVNYTKLHPQKKEILEEVGKSKEVSRVFLKAVSLYEFEHRESFDTAAFIAKYEEYMCEENDAIAEKARRIYLEALVGYLNTLEDAERIKACVLILQRVFTKHLPQKTDSRILRIMNHAMFTDVRLKVIKDCTTADFLCNFADFLENAGIEISPVARAIIEGDTFVMAADENSSYRSAQIAIANMAKDRTFTFANEKLDSAALTDFGDIYLVRVIECARLFASTDEKLFYSFMEEIISYLTQYDRFIVTFDQYLDKDMQRSAKMLTLLFDYTFQIPDTPTSILMQDITLRYLERLSGSKRKKIFEHLCQNVKSRTKMHKYSTWFFTTHKTVGAKKFIFESKIKNKK